MATTLPGYKDAPTNPAPVGQEAKYVRLADIDGLLDHTAGWVNSESYSADPTGAADSTAALTAMLTDGAGKEVRLKDGATYQLRSALSPASGTRITGRAKIQAYNVGTFSAVFSLSSVSDVVIQDVEIDGNTDAGGTVGAGFGVVITGGARNVVRAYIHDTFSEGVKIDGGEGHAVLGGFCINNGRASSTEDHGIAVMAVTSDLVGVRVEGVHVSGANRKGIATYANIAGAKTLSDVVISGNTVKSCALGGIFVGVEPGANPVLGVSVTGNTVSSSYVGIEVASATGAAVSGNTVRGSTHFGMDVSGVQGGTIIGNTVDLSAIHGIHVNDSARASRNVIVSKNVVTNSNTSAAGNGYGIHLNNTTYSIVSENIVADHDASPTQTHGIVEDGTSDYNQFLDNVVVGTVSGAQFYTIGGTHSTVRIALIGGMTSTASPANGGNVTPDTAVADTFTYTAGGGVASFTINAPTDAQYVGKRIWVTVRNTSGGSLTVTWNGAYKLAWSDPATSKRRTAQFFWDGANWCQETMHADAPS